MGHNSDGRGNIRLFFRSVFFRYFYSGAGRPGRVGTPATADGFMRRRFRPRKNHNKLLPEVWVHFWYFCGAGRSWAVPGDPEAFRITCARNNAVLATAWECALCRAPGSATGTCGAHTDAEQPPPTNLGVIARRIQAPVNFQRAKILNRKSSRQKGAGSLLEPPAQPQRGLQVLAKS